MLLPVAFHIFDEQPESREFYLADGVFVKSMHLKQKGQFVPQHSHEYDHHSMLAIGSVRIWEDDIFKGEVSAPKAIFINAGVKHTFESLTDEVLIYCIHNVSRTGEVEVRERHEVV